VSLIRIIPIQFGQVEALEKMLPMISFRFQTEVIMGTHHLDLTRFFDPGRSQYNANEIIQELVPLAQDNDKIVGVTDLDLYIPVLSYIFGQAYLGGSAALVSGHRLESSRYGMIDDSEIFFDRLFKSILHELGHAFGLRHCLHPGCIMVSSTYVEEIDQKADLFCRQCHSELKQFHT
jgi:archaemetzincin